MHLLPQKIAVNIKKFTFSKKYIMSLSEIKQILSSTETIQFELPNGNLVPRHFHVTEVGKISKHFIDCGGTVRKEEIANFQLWSTRDFNHRLHPKKLLDIIELSEKILGLKDMEIEVEYQGETIEKFDLDYAGGNFLLIPMKTDCLAKEKCNILPQKEIVSENKTCAPGAGCC